LSYVDTKLDAAERAGLLAEIKTQLPAFLGAATTERVEVLDDVSALLDLRAPDLRKIVAVHLALTTEVRELVAALPRGLRSPITASITTRSATKAIRGSIDWAETIRLRGRGGLANDFVVRSPRRVFDTPENRALGYLLERLDTELRHVLPARVDQRAGTYNASWLQEIADEIVRLRAARRHHWLRGVASARPTSRVHQRLRAARSSFYSVLIPRALASISTYSEDPSPAAITELLAQRYFEPERDWQLFELAVALRLAKAFQTRSTAKRKRRMLIGAGRSPFARYLMPDGAEVWLWYQAWPTDAADSAHMDALSRYGIEGSPSRPDLVAQRRCDGTPVDTVILELKASRSSSYLGFGLMQLLGYLKDRPSTLGPAPAGWLVAPPSKAFKAAAHGGSDLLVLSTDAVAEALAARFGY